MVKLWETLYRLYLTYYTRCIKLKDEMEFKVGVIEDIKRVPKRVVKISPFIVPSHYKRHTVIGFDGIRCEWLPQDEARTVLVNLQELIELTYQNARRSREQG